VIQGFRVGLDNGDALKVDEELQNPSAIYHGECSNHLLRLKIGAN
jgi:hypothetical protein